MRYHISILNSAVKTTKTENSQNFIETENIFREINPPSEIEMTLRKTGLCWWGTQSEYLLDYS